jgi:hypothetical protein
MASALGSSTLARIILLRRVPKNWVSQSCNASQESLCDLISLPAVSQMRSVFPRPLQAHYAPLIMRQETYSLEYVEDLSGPRSKQMAVHRRRHRTVPIGQAFKLFNLFFNCVEEPQSP